MATSSYSDLPDVPKSIVLIGLIGSVVAYNLRGSLEEGKIFKTQQGGAQVYNILALEVARGNALHDVQANWQENIQRASSLLGFW